jgi:hypothetical protein
VFPGGIPAFDEFPIELGIDDGYEGTGVGADRLGMAGARF